jgi:hypothetical protein
MDCDVFLQKQNLGKLSSVTCYNAEQAYPNIFGSIPCKMEFFEQQIPNFKYPIVVLKNIEMFIRRKGNGTMIMKQFHHWANQHHLHFGILRIGISGDDYESERQWKMNFYQKVGWNLLTTPRHEDLINPNKSDSAPTNDWMYCNFKKCSSSDLDIKFTPQANFHPQIISKKNQL